MKGKRKEDYNKEDIIIGEALKKYRTDPAINKTMQEIATYCEKSISWYSDIERGKNAISFPDMIKVCNFLGIDIKDLTSYINERME